LILQSATSLDYALVPHVDAQALQYILPDLSQGPWVAGGAAVQWYLGNSVAELNANIARDIDVFFASLEQFAQLALRLDNSPCFTKKYTSEYALTYVMHVHEQSIVVQLVKNKYFESLKQLFSNFDIRGVKLATDGNRFESAPGTLDDIHSRVCYFDRINPKTVVSRVFKYLTYGYKVDPQQLEDILSNRSYIELAETGDPYATL
jgi:hypothetical protein